MRFGPHLLDEVLRRTDLVALVGRRVKLTRKGRVFWGCCPFHKEKTASFKVENERRTYHCFGCGAGGDAFKWLMETEGLNFPESVQRLAEEAGVELPAWTPEDEAREQKKKSLYEIISLAGAFFEEQLRGRAGDAARLYLKSRGLEENAWARWHLGFAPDSNSVLRDHLGKQGVAIEDMIEAGLVRGSDGDRGPRDFFFNRLMFPIGDVRGRIVAFGGRALDDEAKPKYINTGETALFSKGHLLFNFKAARDAALKGAPLIVAEGYMDVIALAEAGFTGAVAPLGTALTEDQLQLLWKTAPEPILAFDGDDAGRRAAARAARLALAHLAPGQSLRFAFIPAGDDPDSFIRSQGAEAMRRLLDAAKPLAEVLWQVETEGKDFSTPERRAGLEAALGEIVREIRDGKIADYYKRDFADRIFKAFKQRARAPYAGANRGGAAGGFGRERPRFRPGTGQSRPPITETVSAAVKASLHAINARAAPRRLKEREVVGILLLAPALIERQAESLAEISFQDPELDRLRRELLTLAASGATLEKATLENHLSRQGMGVLVERLTAQRAIHSAGAAHRTEAESLWLRAVAQLEDPDLLPEGDLKTRRDEVLRRYLDGGAAEDWDELQRLGEAIRAAAGPK
jgi:DNA primase